MWMLAMFVLFWFVLARTVFGRHVYATGGNEEAAKLSGVKTDGVQIVVYTISGAMAALAGVILTSRLDSAQPTAGAGYELDAITAVVLGGTSLAGGRGWIFGTLVGALLIGVLNNGLNFLAVSSFYQPGINGRPIPPAGRIDRGNKKQRRGGKRRVSASHRCRCRCGSHTTTRYTHASYRTHEEDMKRIISPLL